MSEKRHRINMLVVRHNDGNKVYKSKLSYEKKHHGNVDAIIDGMMKRMVHQAKEATKKNMGHWSLITFYDNYSNQYPQPKLRQYVYDNGPKLIYPKAHAHEAKASLPGKTGKVPNYARK